MRLVAVVVFMAAWCAVFEWLYACAPQGTPKRVVEDKAFVVLEKAACVLIVSQDPNLSDVCATANELAPLVPAIMARRARDAGVDTGADSRGD